MSQDQNALGRVFGRARVLLPVIHSVTQTTALESIDTAKYSGVLVPERTRLLADRIHGSSHMG